MFEFANSNAQQRCILHEEVNKSKREIGSFVNSMHVFLKVFDQASESIQMPLPKPKTEIGSTKSKDKLFTHYHNDTSEHSHNKIC